MAEPHDPCYASWARMLGVKRCHLDPEAPVNARSANPEGEAPGEGEVVDEEEAFENAVLTARTTPVRKWSALWRRPMEGRLASSSRSGAVRNTTISPMLKRKKMIASAQFP